jgi:hypothetical protein
MYRKVKTRTLENPQGMRDPLSLCVTRQFFHKLSGYPLIRTFAHIPLIRH